MYLEKLEINGFKSFAQKVALEFRPGITTIVGPNGSGKSNTADAMRWVLGEQSIKLLRGKKGEDVIFSGSDKKARLGMAEVTLVFNNEKDEAGLGYTEISITRKIYRDGEAEYIINGQRARLSDIQLLLAKAGVAHTSYSIIGQGMIDAFLLASAADRKEFFEEASGVKPWQIKRQQSINKLALTEENLETAQIQLNEIEPRLNSLTRQVKRLEQRVEIETKLKEKLQRYYAAMWQEVNKVYEMERSKLVVAAEEQKKANVKAEELQRQMALLTKDSANSEVLENLNKKYQEKLQEKMILNEKIAEVKIKLAQLSVSVNRNERAIPNGVGQEIIKSFKSLKLLKEKISGAVKDKNWEEAKKFLAEQEEIFNFLEKTLAPFQSMEKEAPKAENEQNKISEWQAEIKKVDAEIEEIQKNIKKEGEKEKQERSQIWELQQKYQSQQNELNQVLNTVNNLRVEMARWETKKDDLENEIKDEVGGLEWLKEIAFEIEKIDESKKQEMAGEISRLKHQLEMIGGIDPEVQKEYLTTKERFDFLFGQIEDLKNSLEALEKLILELDENIRRQFEQSFKIIDEEFQKHFKTLFGGGKAKLILIKTEDEKKNMEEMSAEIGEEILAAKEDESEVEKITKRLKSTVYAGVEIEATPPGKKLKSISMLSGGERVLTSIALICAIISANPSPFIVLDEVDAALDESNSIRFAEILEQLAYRSQFIVITHNRATMEKANILYGVTMGDDGISKLLSLKLEGAAQYTNR